VNLDDTELESSDEEFDVKFIRTVTSEKGKEEDKARRN
jgi:hypothetical protein